MLREENEARLLAKYLIAFSLQKTVHRNDGDVFSIWVCPEDSKWGKTKPTTAKQLKENGKGKQMGKKGK